MRPRSARPLGLLGALGLVAGLACSSSAPPEESRAAPETITVGAYDFAESLVLAHVYSEALRAEGYDTSVLSEVASREVMGPAMEQAQIDLVPEYQGSLLAFLTLGDARPSAAPALTHRRLAAECAERDLVALDFAPGENKNELVVREDTARRLKLERISDLAAYADAMVLGGPPECPGRPLCLKGLRETYGLEFRSFLPLDVGGPRTHSALEGGEIDVGVLFTTDPALDSPRLRILEDDRNLQPSENITPVLRREALDVHGAELAEVVDAVSERLTTSELRRLNEALDAEEGSARDVATEWLDAQGLT